MPDTQREPRTSVADLRDQLMQAYLSGDGAAVERVMALIAAAEGEQALRTRRSREAA